MCGIVGCVTTNPTTGSYERKRWFEQALLVDTVRGVDSTGCFFVNDRTGAVDTIKRPVAAWHLMEMSPYNNLMNKFNSYEIAIGHNRAATRGKVNTENAHPFTFGTVTGVHNGTLQQVHKLPRGSSFGVDSQAALNAIDELGSVDALKEITGAFAFVWYDIEDERLHVVRNSERSLGYAIDKKGETLYLASEMPMLAWLAMRNNIQLEVMESFEEGYEYQIDSSGKTIEVTREKREFARPFVSNTAYSHAHGQQHGSRQQQGSGSSRRIRPSEETVRQIGYNLDKYVDMMMFDWEPYRKSDRNYGIIYGYTLDEKCTPVMLHGSHITKFEQFSEQTIKAKVVGGIDMPKGDKIHPDLTGQKALLCDAKSIYPTTSSLVTRGSSKSTDSKTTTGSQASEEDSRDIILAGEDDESPFTKAQPLH